MVTCDLCGRQFKNTQGLRGHKTFVHDNGSPSSTSVAPADAEELNEVTDHLNSLTPQLASLSSNTASYNDLLRIIEF